MNPRINTSTTDLPYETKQRLIAARAKGMSEQNIQKYVQRDLVEQQVRQAQQQQQPVASKKGNWFTSLLPTLTSVAALGLAPFTGGGSLGLMALGAGGGILGKVGQKALEGKPILSDPGGYLTEGAFGAVPGVFKGAKALRHADKGAKMAALLGKTGSATKAASLADDYAKQTMRGKVGNVGDDLVARNRGLEFGAGHTTTRAGLGHKDVAKWTKYLDDIGAKGSVKQQGKVVQTHLDDLYKQQAAVLGKGNQLLPKGSIAKIKTSVDDIVRKTPGLKLTDDLANDLAKLSRTRSVRSLTQFRRDLDNLAINWGRSASSNAPTKEAFYRTLRDQVDNVIKSTSKGMAKLDPAISQARGAMDMLKAGAKGVKGYKVPLLGNRLPKDFSSSVADKMGRALQFAGGKPASFAGGAAKVTAGVGANAGKRSMKTLLKQAAQIQIPKTLMGKAEQAPANAFASPEQIAQLGLDPTALGLGGQTDPLAQQAGGFSGGAPQTGTQSIPKELIIEAMLADPQNAQMYMDIFEFMQPPSSSVQDLNFTQQKEANNAMSGIDAINQIRQELGKGGITQQLTAVPGAGMFGGLGDRLLGTAKLETASKEAADVITRLRTGAAINANEEKFYKSQLPQAFDSQEVVEYKLAMLETLFNRFMNPAGARQEITARTGNAYGGNATDLSQLLGGFTGAQ